MITLPKTARVPQNYPAPDITMFPYSVDWTESRSDVNAGPQISTEKFGFLHRYLHKVNFSIKLLTLKGTVFLLPVMRYQSSSYVEKQNNGGYQ